MVELCGLFRLIWGLVYVEINGTIVKYEKQRKTPDLRENPCGKKLGAEEKASL